MRIKNKFKFIRSMAILIFLLIALSNISVAKSNEEAKIISYTVSNGETLWSIAEEYKAENEDPRQYIYDIKKLNNMDNSNIYEGQILQIIKEP